jgi:hypothetical protein
MEVPDRTVDMVASGERAALAITEAALVLPVCCG